MKNPNLDLVGLVNKVKENIFSIALLVFAFIFAVNVFKAKQAELQSLSASIASEEEKNKILGDIEILERKFTSLKQKVNTKSSASPLETLNNLLEQAGLKVESSKAQSEVSSGAYNKKLFELLVSSESYHKIGKFISLLEKSPDNFFVESISLNSDSKDESSNKMTARLVISMAVVP